MKIVSARQEIKWRKELCPCLVVAHIAALAFLVGCASSEPAWLVNIHDPAIFIHKASATSQDPCLSMYGTSTYC